MAAAIGVILIAGCGSTVAEEPNSVQRLSVKLADSSTGFGLNLLDHLLAEPGAGNVFISPLSATIALSMAASAARGDARAAMLRTLGLDPTVDPSGELRQTIQRLNQSDPNAQLELAQAVWLQNGLKLNSAYEAKLHDDYQAQLANLNFNDPNAPAVVNKWIDAKTHDKIQTLVDEFKPNTVGFLANATYFHALWTTEFKPMKTTVDFRQFSGQTVAPPMMRRDDDVVALLTRGYVAVVLPYKGGRFSAVLILPSGVLSPADFGRFITASLWTQTMEAFHAATGPTLSDKCRAWSQGDAEVRCGWTLQMPKFTLDYHEKLTATLHALGMPIPGANVPDFCDGCYIDDVVQGTHLEVDEHGVTAAAATGVAIRVCGCMTVVNRPFAFAIVDNATDAPLFLGAIGDL